MKRILIIAFTFLSLTVYGQDTPDELKDRIDDSITSVTAPRTIKATNVGARLKEVVDFANSRLGTDTLGSYMELVDPYTFLDEAENDTGLAIQYAINYIQGVREVSFDEETGDVVLDSVAPHRSAAIRVRSQVHRINRGLVKNVTGVFGTRYVNSQLYIPLVVRLDSANKRKPNQIVFLGDAPPTYMVNYLNPLFWSEPSKEPVLYSTISNDGSSFPAVIRAVPDSLLFLGSYLSNNLTELHFENIAVRVHHDTANGGTQLSGIDLHNTSNQSMHNFRVDCDVDNYYTVEPEYEVFGIRSGVWGSGNNQLFNNGIVTGGFKWATVGYEHSIWHNVVALANYYAVGSATANYPMVLDNYGMVGNKYLIHAGRFAISSAATENKISGSIRVESNTLGKWYDRDASFDIVDSLNKLVGPLEWYITTGSPIDTIRVKGGSNLQLEFKYSITSGTAKYKYPGKVRHNLGGTQFDVIFNGNGSTPAANSQMSLIGNAINTTLYIKDSMSTGFANVILDNDRANSGTQAIIQLGGSAEVQGSLFGSNRRDVLTITTNGANNRGIRIGPATADSLGLGASSNAYAWLTPTGNWHFSPPNSFLIYNPTNKLYNMGFGTTTPATIGGQVTTDRRVSQETDSARVMHRVITGTGGAILDMIDLSATANQRRFEIANINGVVGLYAPNDAGSGLTSSPGSINLSTGNWNFGASAAAVASAQVEITSTTKGFLKPRLTQAQRNAISSPAAWLEITCTDCTATDGSTGVDQTYNPNTTTWKNHW